MKIKKWLVMLMTALVLFPGMTRATQAQAKKRVVTTFYPVYFLTQAIAGDQLEVEILLDGGEDAHDYELSVQDAANIQGAAAFIYQDDEMEHFVQDVLNIIDPNQTRVLEATQGIELLELGHSEEDHQNEEEGANHDNEGEDHTHERDPHTWLDPELYAQQAATIYHLLREIMPESEAEFAKNLEEIKAKLGELDQEFATQLQKRSGRTFVVQHPAFGYLAAAYGLEQVAITALNSQAEPTAKELANIQAFIQENQVKVIYVDPNMPVEVSQTVAAATNVEIRPLRTLEAISQAEMASGIDYFKIMQDNLLELSR